MSKATYSVKRDQVIVKRDQLSVKRDQLSVKSDRFRVKRDLVATAATHYRRRRRQSKLGLVFLFKKHRALHRKKYFYICIKNIYAVIKKNICAVITSPEKEKRSANHYSQSPLYTNKSSSSAPLPPEFVRACALRKAT
jgi:hypothetical protein